MRHHWTKCFCGNAMWSTESLCDWCWYIVPEEIRPWKHLHEAYVNGWPEFERRLALAKEWLQANTKIPREKPRCIPWGFREENQDGC